MRQARVYITGPMRGVPYFNFPAFDAAKEKLERLGYIAVSPADIDREFGFDAMALPADTDWREIPDELDLRVIVARDIEALLGCEAVYALPNSDTSSGAKAELAVADWLGMYRVSLDEGADAHSAEGGAS